MISIKPRAQELDFDPRSPASERSPSLLIALIMIMISVGDLLHYIYGLREVDQRNH